MKKVILASAAISLSIAMSAGTTAASPKTHTVSANDTFWKLSMHYNIPLKSLMEANAAIDPLQLRVGMKLAIPEDLKSTMQASMTNTSADESAEGLIQGPGGYDYVFTKQLNVQATAYTASASENGKWGAVDYFGNKLQIGTIAVDPNVIPLGTKLYITGYSYNGLPRNGMIATATDMGGSIKGNRIDIFVPDSRKQAFKFGIQPLKAYILK